MMRKHILVVDDDAALVSLLKMRLKNAWYTVDTAETGWDGLTKLEQGDYDVVLLDYMMPGITGITVLQHIQARYPSMPVIMMTGDITSQVGPQALARGARAYLVKPVGPCGVGAGSAVLGRNSCISTVVAGRRNDIEEDATGDGPMKSPFAYRP